MLDRLAQPPGTAAGGEDVGWSAARSLRARDTGRRALQRAPVALVRFAVDVAQELQRLEPFDRAMTLAAQAFTSIFPLVIAAFAVLPSADSGRLGSRLVEELALPAETRNTLLSNVPPDQAWAFGGLGLLVVLLSATSFSRALTRMYERAWSVQGPGWHGGWRWIAVLVVIAACTIGLKAAQRAAADGSLPPWGTLLLTLVVSTLLWTWVPHVLLAGRVAWRLHVPGGVLMGTASVVLYIAGRIYMPPAFKTASRRFGDLGVAFTCIGWLFCVGFALIVMTVIGCVLVREGGL